MVIFPRASFNINMIHNFLYLNSYLIFMYFNHLQANFFPLFQFCRVLYSMFKSHRNQSADFQCKSMDWFLQEGVLCEGNIALKWVYLFTF